MLKGLIRLSWKCFRACCSILRLVKAYSDSARFNVNCEFRTAEKKLNLEADPRQRTRYISGVL